MKRFLLVAPLLIGCGKTKDGCHPDNWTCRARYEYSVGENVDKCIERKLDSMSDADHTSSWSAELVKALHQVCKQLYPYGFDGKRP